MSRTDKKMMKKNYKVAVTGVIVTIISLGFIIYDHMYHEPKADIQDNAISVEYLSAIRDDDNIFPMFSDEINSKTQFKGNCATQVLITNDNNEELLLDKIIFEAEDIKVNENPDLIIDLEAGSEGNAYFSIYNDGWGDAENLHFTFKGEDINLDDLIPTEKQVLNVKKIRYGTGNHYELWTDDDLLDSDYTGVLVVKPYCVNDGGKQIDLINQYGEKTVGVYVSNGKFTLLGRGDCSQEIYGIKINTAENSFQFESSISETIKAFGRLELPICFAPDKSCSFKFKVKFEVVSKGNKKEYISTKTAKVDFKVSSFLSNNFNDARDFSADELRESLESRNGLAKVSYPFADYKLMENVGQ